MTEETPPNHEIEGVPVRWRKRVAAAIGSLTFCGLMIVGLTVWGDPANALHKMASENAWWAAFAVLMLWLGGEGVQQWGSLREVIRGQK